MKSFLALLAELGRGPQAVGQDRTATGRESGAARSCPVGRVASLWQQSRASLATFEQQHRELVVINNYLQRHLAIGWTSALPADSSGALARSAKVFASKAAEVSELKAQWQRGAEAELRYVNCSDALLTSAVANPGEYSRTPTFAGTLPLAAPIARKALGPPPTAKFVVDNVDCDSPVTVWLDGTRIGEVAAKSRSEFATGAGEHTMCLMTAGSTSCGDRGTVRQPFISDGWSVAMRCPK
jgi:hypothetical protein